jgi:TM2 domain-containing membrane protein YozV
MRKGSSLRLAAALLFSALWPGLGSLIVGQPLLGLTLMAVSAASVLATILFYGYVTTPIIWAVGLIVAAVGARRRAVGLPRWPARRFGLAAGLLALLVGGLVAFNMVWTVPKAPRPPIGSRAGPPTGPSLEAVVWSGPGGYRIIDPEAHPSLSVNELGSLRWWLALADQPLGRWEGFYSMDQFGQTALRYQLAFASYGLAQAQAVKLPAYRSPVVKVLGRLVEKMLLPDVWDYWRWESLAGFGRMAEDPVANANVMYSGHLASMAGLARLVSGKPLYEAPSSLSFTRAGETVASYTYRSLLGGLARQFRENPWHAIACEPHQVFVMCNNHAALGLILGARLLDKNSLAEAASLYAEAYWRLFSHEGDEGPSLRYPYYPPLDRTLPFHLVLGDGWAIATLNGLMPDEARIQYEAYRQRVFGSGGLRFGRVRASTLHESIDIGNMRPSLASQAAFALLAAREMGDEAGARELLATIEGRYGPRWVGGRRTYRGLSPLLHAVVFLARLTPPGGVRALFGEARVADAWKAPHLEAVEGGPLDVVQAVYSKDEEALLVGLVGGRGEGRRALRVAGLDPARAYTLVSNGRIAATALRPRPDGTLRIPVAGEVPLRCILAAHPRSP